MGVKVISVLSCLLASICMEVSGQGLQGRIVNGQPARLGEAPYQLLMLKDESAHCGATLVTLPNTGEQLAITAAHCVSDPVKNPTKSFSPNQITLRGGHIKRDRGMDMRVKKIILHPKWKGTFAGDLALLILDGEFELSNTLKAAKLPNGGVNLPQGTKVTVSGWGATEEQGHMKEALQIVKLPVVDNSICSGIYKKIFDNSPTAVIDDSHICLGYKSGGKDACQGDSGGPAVIKGSNNDHILVGAVSLGHGCARPGTPGIYTRISNYLSWISKTFYQDGKTDS